MSTLRMVFIVFLLATATNTVADEALPDWRQPFTPEELSRLGASQESLSRLEISQPVSSVFKGLDGVRVLTEDVREDAKRDGLRPDDIQTQIELRLRTLGIRVLSMQGGSVGTWPCLYVNVNTLKTNYGYAASISVAFQETVKQNRPPYGLVYGATLWEERLIQACGGRVDFAKYTKEGVLELVDRFANEYLAANPKK